MNAFRWRAAWRSSFSPSPVSFSFLTGNLLLGARCSSYALCHGESVNSWQLVTEHIQHKTTLLNSFFIHHPCSLASALLCSLLSLPVCVHMYACVVNLGDIVTNVTSQNHYSRSPICYTLRDLYIHTHTQSTWQLGVSAGAAIIPVESSWEGYHVSVLSLSGSLSHLTSLCCL